MKINTNGINFNNYNSIKDINSNATSLWVKNKKSMKDSYISSVGLNQYDEGKWVKDTYISSVMLDLINFEYRKCLETADSFFSCGIEFEKSQIPDIDTKRCLSIKEENNKIVFDEKKYYKFIDELGKTHILACAYNRLSSPYSDTSRGIVDDTSNEISKFWNMLSKDGTYMSLYYSHDMQRKLLNGAGIKEGFFSVQVGINKKEYYYSNGIAGVAVPKTRYDATYNMFMNREGIFDDFEVGAVFKIGGEEYILSSDKKLDIPYGADIYDIEYPPRKVSY